MHLFFYNTPRLSSPFDSLSIEIVKWGFSSSGRQDLKFGNGSLLAFLGRDAGDHHKLASITTVLPVQLVKKERLIEKVTLQDRKVWR